MNGKFFTFPLCLLAMPYDEKTILQHIVSSALERAGGGNSAALIDKEKIVEYAIEHENIGYTPSVPHDQLIRGAIMTNVTLGWIQATVDRCDAATKFVGQHERKHGTDPLVFVAAELFWSCHNDQDFSFREFSTTCAVNSINGFKKTPVIIRRSMIQARQLGYKTPAVMTAEIKTSPQSPVKGKQYRKPLSTQQLRDTLDNLEGRDLFRRCQPGRRTVYFSTTLDLAELRAAVKERVEKRSKVQLRRQTDLEMFAKPGRNQSGTNEEPLKKAEGKSGEIGTFKVGTSQEPDGNQLETACGTTGGTTTGTTKINAPIINAPLIKALKEKRVIPESPVELLENEIDVTPPYYPDGGEPTVDEVSRFMESKAAGAGKLAKGLLETMKKRGWVDVGGEPVKDWKAFFEMLCR